MAGVAALPGLLKPAATAEEAEWLAKVDKIAPLINEHRDQAERDRVTSPVVFDALRDSGVTGMWVAKAFGGEQISVRTGSAVIQALSRLDGSVGWQVGVQGAIARLSDYLAEPVATELFNGRVVVGGVTPTGRAEAVPGGYLLSGEWAFASGSAHADWLVCGAFVTKDGTMVQTPNGPWMLMLFAPCSAATILDTWHAVGLRGTGSNHYRVSEAFVPEDYTISGAMLGQAPVARPARAFPISYLDFGLFAYASTALGVAQDAVDSLKELMLGKTPALGSGTLALNHTAQEKLGRAEMLVYTAGLLLRDAVVQAVEFGETGADALASLIRLTGATVAENTVAAVDIAYNLAGTSSIYTSNRLERCFRDVHTATKHIMLSPSHFETVGQYLLGGPLRMRP